jgi:sulfatase maturation enzyme AslB (radical SAM superfamily)
MNEKLLEKHLVKELDHLKKIVIIQLDDGSYELYDKYRIQKKQDGTYLVTVYGTFTEKNFYKLKNATAWCGYDRRNYNRDAKRIHQLDQMIYSMDNEIQIHTALVKKAKVMETKLIYLSKLTEDKAKKRKFSDELSRFLTEFDRYQNKLYDRKPTY